MRLFLCAFLLFSGMLSAQITSASLSSNIEINGLPATNVELVLIHQPTNYRYYSSTDKKGYFEFTDLEVGGPYKLGIIINNEIIYREYEYLILGENDVKKIILK